MNRKMQEKIEQIVSWLKQVYGERPAVIAVSGGVDSAVALTLLSRALGSERITSVLLPYGKQDMKDAKTVVEKNGLMHKCIEVDINKMVDMIKSVREIGDEKRLGNVMARVRMIVIFDLAKKLGALVCGTENKSEHYLGYYTRFGDAASDIEPISSLYKTEVWEMAKELELPEVFYTKAPSAGLWQGQTDESEMGFSYLEADKVLQGQTERIEPIVVEKVRQMVADNEFKRLVPYELGDGSGLV